jgi:hypothetical protein
MSFSLGDFNQKLCLGGYTPLWIAPEYSGPATFGELRAMDTFSFGMLVGTVVQNGKSVLTALSSSVSPDEVDAFLKTQKSSPGLIELLKRAAQLPGYCEDILLEDFSTILEYTLGSPQSRELENALETLRRYVSISARRLTKLTTSTESANRTGQGNCHPYDQSRTSIAALTAAR